MSSAYGVPADRRILGVNHGVGRKKKKLCESRCCVDHDVVCKPKDKRSNLRAQSSHEALNPFRVGLPFRSFLVRVNPTLL